MFQSCLLVRPDSDDGWQLADSWQTAHVCLPAAALPLRFRPFTTPQLTITRLRVHKQTTSEPSGYRARRLLCVSFLANLDSRLTANSAARLQQNETWACGGGGSISIIDLSTG